MKHCHRAIRMNTWIFYAKCVMLLSCWNWDHLQGKFKRAGLFQKIGYIGRYVPGLSSYVKKVFLNTYASYEIQMASQFIEWVVFKQHRLSQKNYSCVTIRLLWIVLEWRNMLFYYMLNCPLMHVAIRGPHSQRRLLIGASWGCYEYPMSQPNPTDRKAWLLLVPLSGFEAKPTNHFSIKGPTN